ncbi:MAG: hypothetical protein V7609_2158 [Verrucomicrobiota bacterium]
MVMRAKPHTEDFLRLVIETVPTMAWSLRADGMVDYVNQRWRDYTGLSLEEETEEPTRPIHPDDVPRVMEKWFVGKATGDAYEDEMRLRRADGEYRWFLVRTAPLRDEQGNIIKWFGVSIDIEDRKQVEMQSRVLIDAIPQQIWSAPPDGKTDYCNNRWRSYTGLELENLRGYGWQTMVHPEDRDRVLKAWRESVATGTPYEQEERHRGTDGKYRWFLARGVPMRDPQGRIVRWYGTNTDIEDRKQAEEALHRSEKLFAAFMDHLPGFAWMKDIEGRYVYVNKKEAELGVYGDGAIGKIDAELWPADIAAAYRANDQQVIATRKAMQAVEPSLTNGDRSQMLVSKFPIFHQDGRVVMVAGAGVDITDLTQAKDALNAQALRYKTLMETSTDSIYVLDENGDLQEANVAFLRQRGYTAAEMKGLNVADWNARLSREQLQERMRKLRDSSAVFETRHRCKDGSIFDVEVCATGVQIGGEQLIFCVTRDISERKQAEGRLRRSEEKFKALFDLAPVGISVLDWERNIIDANPALEQITRLSREELSRGVYLRRTILNGDGTPQPPHEFASALAISQNRPISNLETGIVMENGETVWVQVSVAPLALPDASAVCIAQDITERKRAAEELKEANRQLRILSGQLFHIQEEERRHLARELHDEIGQALTAAKINLKIIAPEVPANASGRLTDSIELLDRLLIQVRQLSLDLHPSLLDDLGLAPALRSLLDQQAHRAGLRTRFYASESFETLNSGIQTTGFRIAQEAITNVLRHAKAQVVSVHLETDTGQLRIRIVDDGKGFDLAEVERRAHEGLGFGLLGMRERAGLVGGRVRIISSPGKGTTVEVSLPFDSTGEDQTG